MIGVVKIFDRCNETAHEALQLASPVFLGTDSSCKQERAGKFVENQWTRRRDCDSLSLWQKMLTQGQVRPRVSTAAGDSNSLLNKVDLADIGSPAPPG